MTGRKKLEGAKEFEVNDDELKAAKASKSKAAVKAAKKHKKEIAAQNQEIKLAPFVLKEMSKFESELGKRQIADANMIYNAGLAGLGTYSVKELRENLRKAKALPKNTEEEKEMRQYAIHFCRTRLTARKYQKKILRRQDNGSAGQQQVKRPVQYRRRLRRAGTGALSTAF